MDMILPVFILVELNFRVVKKRSTEQPSGLFISILAGLYILSVLWHLGYLDLRIEEARRAIVSLEMLHSGNFVQPKTLGWEYFNKPPFFNWVLAGFIEIAGSDSEFVLRLPSFCSLLALGIIHYFVAKRFLPRTVAILSVFFTLTCTDLYFYTLSNGTEIDVFYSLVVYLQAISMFWFYEKKNFTLLFLCSWALCAIGFLTKGYPSLLFQVLTMVALCVYGRDWKILFKWQQLSGMILFGAITGSYYYIYSQYSDPAIPLITLLRESLLKSIVGEESKDKWYRVFTYPVVLFRVLAPWCLLFLLLLKRPRAILWNNPLTRFAGLFILLNIAVYWITGAQKTRYIIMFIPFAMTIAAYIYWQWEKQNSAGINSYLKFAGLFFFLVTGALLALVFFVAVDWWKVAGFASLMVVFLFFYYRTSRYRIWMFLLGFILTRLVYAAIGIAAKEKGQYDYEGLAFSIAAGNNYQPVDFWGYPDTLNMNVIIGDTLYKWRGDNVNVIPFFIRYQLPFYLYKATGQLSRFDTMMKAGKTYISFGPFLATQQTETLDSVYDRQFGDYLKVFRKSQVEDDTVPFVIEE